MQSAWTESKPIHRAADTLRSLTDERTGALSVQFRTCCRGCHWRGCDASPFRDRYLDYLNATPKKYGQMIRPNTAFQ